MKSDQAKALITELSEVGKDAVAQGLVLASGGNLSARLDDGSFIVTGTGTWLNKLHPSSFSHISADGEFISGAKPSSEWKLHWRTYQVRDDAKSIIHLHPQYAVMITSLGKKIRQLTLDQAYYLGKINVTPFYHNGSDELADTAAEAAKTADCVVMQHHGSSTVADSIEMAYRRAMNLEQAAMTTYRMLLLGDETINFPEDKYNDLHHA